MSDLTNTEEFVQYNKKPVNRILMSVTEQKVKLLILF